MQDSAQPLSVYVSDLRNETPTIRLIELRCETQMLPPFSAGAHVDLHLPGGMVRSYSLLNDPRERHRYVLAVQREENSRGGSAWVHEQVRMGDRLWTSAPRNHFELNEDAEQSVLIAGGIGITPLLSMMSRLDSLGRAWTLHYACRTRAAAPFQGQLRQFEKASPGRVHLYFDHERDGRPMDLHAITAVDAGAHLYCCGPVGMLDAFTQITAGRDAATVHVERFAGVAPLVQEAFTIVLARSGRELSVPAGKSILEALLDEGFEIPCSCMEGTCGSCETGVLEGVPDHRDVVLTPDQKLANDRMMICCSGSRSDRLVLDI